MSLRAQIAKVTLMGQFLVTLTICVCTASGISISAETAGCIIGLICVQILLSAVWTAMGSASFSIRLLSGVGIVLFLVACFYSVAWRDGGGHGVALSLSLPMLFLWFGIQTPLWIARAKGWRLKDPNNHQDSYQNTEFQFGIGQLLIWTTVVAVSIASIKLFIAQLDSPAGGGGGPPPSEFVFGVLLAIGASLIAMPISWGAFVNRHAWFWFLAAIVMCALVSYAQILVLSGSGDYKFLYLANLVQTGLSVAAMILVRLLGLRLIQVHTVA